MRRVFVATVMVGVLAGCGRTTTVARQVRELRSDPTQGGELVDALETSPILVESARLCSAVLDLDAAFPCRGEDRAELECWPYLAEHVGEPHAHQLQSFRTLPTSEPPDDRFARFLAFCRTGAPLTPLLGHAADGEQLREWFRAWERYVRSAEAASDRLGARTRSDAGRHRRTCTSTWRVERSASTGGAAAGDADRSAASDRAIRFGGQCDESNPGACRYAACLGDDAVTGFDSLPGIAEPTDLDTSPASGQRSLLSGSFDAAVIAQGLAQAIEQRAQEELEHFVVEKLYPLVCGEVASDPRRVFLRNSCVVLHAASSPEAHAMSWATLREALENDIRRLPAAASEAILETPQAAAPEMVTLRLALYLVAQLTESTDPQLFLRGLADRMAADRYVGARAAMAVRLIAAIFGLANAGPIRETALLGVVNTSLAEILLFPRFERDREGARDVIRELRSLGCSARARAHCVDRLPGAGAGPSFCRWTDLEDPVSRLLDHVEPLADAERITGLGNDLQSVRDRLRWLETRLRAARHLRSCAVPSHEIDVECEIQGRLGGEAARSPGADWLDPSCHAASLWDLAPATFAGMCVDDDGQSHPGPTASATIPDDAALAALVTDVEAQLGLHTSDVLAAIARSITDVETTPELLLALASETAGGRTTCALPHDPRHRRYLVRDGSTPAMWSSAIRAADLGAAVVAARDAARAAGAPVGGRLLVRGAELREAVAAVAVCRGSNPPTWCRDLARFAADAGCRGVLDDPRLAALSTALGPDRGCSDPRDAVLVAYESALDRLRRGRTANQQRAWLERAIAGDGCPAGDERSCDDALDVVEAARELCGADATLTTTAILATGSPHPWCPALDEVARRRSDAVRLGVSIVDEASAVLEALASAARGQSVAACDGSATQPAWCAEVAAFARDAGCGHVLEAPGLGGLHQRLQGTTLACSDPDDAKVVALDRAVNALRSARAPSEARDLLGTAIAGGPCTRAGCAESAAVVAAARDLCGEGVTLDAQALVDPAARQTICAPAATVARHRGAVVASVTRLLPQPVYLACAGDDRPGWCAAAEVLAGECPPAVGLRKWSRGDAFVQAIADATGGVCPAALGRELPAALDQLAAGEIDTRLPLARELRAIIQEIEATLRVLSAPDTTPDARLAQLAAVADHYVRALDLAIRLATGREDAVIPRSVGPVLSAIAQADIARIVASVLDLVREVVTDAGGVGGVVPDSVVRTLALAGQVAEADTSEEVRDAVLSFAAPVGSWRGKRDGAVRLYLNALVGVTSGIELYNGVPYGGGELWDLSIGGHASLGFYLNVAGHVPEGAIGFYVPVVDVTPWTSLAVIDQGRFEIDEINPLSILSPGLYFWAGLFDSPFVVAVGYSFTPRGRRMPFTGPAGDAQTAEVDVHRFQLVLGVDVTLLPF